MSVDRSAESSDGRRDLVVIGASAGGVEVLTRVARDLPADLRAAVCIVLHISPGSPSMLAHILGRAGTLPCRAARDGERLREGLILVAPPDHHLVIEDGHVRLTVGPRENGHRPAIDVLFRSAAEALDSRVIGVILSGTRDDGSAGLAVIKASGGATIVQDPEEALYGGMPTSAIANVAVDAIVKSDLVASTIVSMVKGENPSPGAPSETPDPKPPAPEPNPARGASSGSKLPRGPLEGEPVSAICPECGGVLSERPAAGVVQWECRVGHRYSRDTLLEAQADSVESALWAAVRALNDRAILLGRMAEQGEKRGQMRSARRFRRQSDAASEQAQIVLQAFAGAARTTLRRVVDDEEDGVGEEGAA
ncbi:MAG TPA: chemotaxis protein CheB [Solirubrobacteraceae bacterium]|nr:chemotaxis protein CheB [Solirubrobacteraceae bacterium]